MPAAHPFSGRRNTTSYGGGEEGIRERGTRASTTTPCHSPQYPILYGQGDLGSFREVDRATDCYSRGGFALEETKINFQYVGYALNWHVVTVSPAHEA